MYEHEQSVQPGPVRRPLVGLAVVFLAGLLAAPMAGDWSPVPVVAAAGLLTVLAVAGRPRRLASPALFAAVALAGLARGMLDEPRFSARELAAQLQRPREQAELCGLICDDPVALPSPRPGVVPWSFRMRLEGAQRTEGGWRRSRGEARVRLLLDASDPGPVYGDRWRLSGVVSRTERGPAGGLFFEVRREGAECWGRGGGHPVLRWCYERRRACRAILHRGLEQRPESANFVESLLLGYRDDLPDEVRDDFLRTGTLHIFAVSGSHVAVMVAILRPVLRASGMSTPTLVAAMGPLLALYTMATGAAASAVRALIMALAYWSALFFRRRPDSLSALALAAVVIVAAVPSQLRDAGFLYSFVTVLGLIVLAPRLGRPLLEPLRRDPWEAGGESRLRRWTRAAKVWAVGLAVTSVAAWIVSTPLSARFANLVSPSALIGNLLMIPGAALVMLTGCLSLLSGFAWDGFAVVFNSANHVFVSTLLAIADLLAAAPGSHAYVQAPPTAALVLFYAALAGFVALRGRARAVLAAAVVAVAGAGAGRYVSDDRMTVWLPGAALAPAAFLDLPGGAGDLLLDPGPAYRGARLVRFLRSRGVDRLRAVILTQADADHAGALPEVLRKMPVGEVWCPADPGRSRVFRATVEAARAAGLPILPRAAGERGALAGGGEWEVFHPQPGQAYARAADSALAVRFARGAAAVLFAGPAARRAAESLELAPTAPCAGALVLDRSGAADGDDVWLERIRPDWLILRALPGEQEPGPGPVFGRAAADGALGLARPGPGGWRLDLKEEPEWDAGLGRGRAIRVSPW